VDADDLLAFVKNDLAIYSTPSLFVISCNFPKVTRIRLSDSTTQGSVIKK
jgi:hypothetical protein